VTAPCFGVDIGGSRIKLGLVDEGGVVLARESLPYPAFRDFESLVDGIADALRAMERRVGQACGALGLAAPGHARPEDGMMVDGTANVPLLRDRALAPLLAARLGLPAFPLNDGTAAAMGEWAHGAGRSLQRFAVLTLGTGVGGGIVLHGRIITGEEGIPPELGAIVLQDARDPGARRTLEDFAGAAGWCRTYREAGGGDAEPRDILARAAQGEDAARAVLTSTARRIAQACGMLTNALNLQACILAGGIAGAGETLRAPVAAALPEFCWPFLLVRMEVVLARLGGEAGLIGAAAHARRMSAGLHA
jgi:glucokinase